MVTWRDVAAYVLAIRDALPLANMQINELERPLRLITLTADVLEKQFVGADVM